MGWLFSFFAATSCYLRPLWHTAVQRKQRKRLFVNAFNISPNLNHKVKNWQRVSLKLFSYHFLPNLTLTPNVFAANPTHMMLLHPKPFTVNFRFFCLKYLGLCQTGHGWDLVRDPTCSRRCSFNAQISHGVKYPQLPHKIHNLQLGRGGEEGVKPTTGYYIHVYKGAGTQLLCYIEKAV